MPKDRLLNGVLFWLLLVLGGVTLAPCLLPPAWLERRAQEDYLAAHQAYLARLQEHLTATQMQIEHLKHDPAYVLRMAEEELGDTIDLPKGELIPIGPSPETRPAAGRAEDAPAAPPTVGVFFEQVLDRHPRLRVFVTGPARPFIMFLGGALLLAAIALLGFVGGRPPANG